MDSDKAALLLQLVARLPLVAKVTLLHALRLSPQAKYLDLHSDLTVALLRSFIAPRKPMSITHAQRLFNRDRPVKGRLWVAKYTAPPPPEPSARDAVVRAVEAMRAPAPDGTPPPPLPDGTWPRAVPVEAEWTGFRRAATASSRLPPILELEKYAELMREVTSPTTVLYLHGGAYYLMDPATHRPTTARLAKLTGGRCYSVRYRLAPQNPFPAALVDALQSYLTLLRPPKGAFHEPVKPEHIVFAGDSAGGNLCMALTQLLLELRRTATTVQWHGETLAVPLPAGVALSSPWLDMTHSSPSCTGPAPFDYLPAAPPAPPAAAAAPPRPPCAAWPAAPPRRALYCADALATHPLVTPLAARAWAGCPPVYVSAGWERLADEAALLAARLHAQGVAVVWERFEAMPHCFALVLPARAPPARRGLAGWAAFIAAAAAAAATAAPPLPSAFRTVRARSLREEPCDPAALAPYSEEQWFERLRSLASAAPAGTAPPKL